MKVWNNLLLQNIKRVIFNIFYPGIELIKSEKKLRQQGFTLIELLIAISIMTILSISGYAYYQNHLVKSYRHQAKVALIDLATQFEQYHILHDTYPTNLDSFTIKNQLHDRYQFTINSVDKYTYLILATPIKQQNKDTECGTLGYDQLGIRTISGSGTVATCWGYY